MSASHDYRGPLPDKGPTLAVTKIGEILGNPSTRPLQKVSSNTPKRKSFQSLCLVQDPTSRELEGKRRKRKKGAANDDEDDDVWTGKSEEDAELIKKLKNDPKPKRPKEKQKGSEYKNVGGFIVDDGDIGVRINEDVDEETDEDDEEEELMKKTDDE
ncbi:hypothetical protein Tco_0384776 [Tanacetum coccineum]